MAVLHDPSVYECDADNLNVLLAGKDWKALEQAYIDANPDDYVLMHPGAVQAFLAAWLSRAADDLDGSNYVRSSLLFHLNSVGALLQYESGWARGLALLTSGQAQAIRVLIHCVAVTASTKEDMQEARRVLAKLHKWFPEAS